MITLTYILIYLVWVVASYFVGRNLSKKFDRAYTKANRAANIICSLLFPIYYVAVIIIVVRNQFNSTDEASW